MSFRLENQLGLRVDKSLRLERLDILAALVVQKLQAPLPLWLDIRNWIGEPNVTAMKPTRLPKMESFALSFRYIPQDLGDGDP
jgi:hypothetical protein